MGQVSQYAAKFFATASLTAVLSLVAPQLSLSDEIALSSSPPYGNYLWYPEAGGPKSDADCEALVEKLKPTDEMVRQWQWGQLPNEDFDDMPFFLIVSPGRIETTFGAEGDYDNGNVVFGRNSLGETPFTLTPDDHPYERLKGSIVAIPGSQIVTVTMFDVPVDDEAKDRISYFCRFEDLGTEI